MLHTWMLMPGQSWLGATASFVGMWTAMMAAMMLPSLIPTLLCYGKSVASAGAARPALLTALVAVGYFAIWSALGAIVFPLGVLVADVTMKNAEISRLVPIAVGVTAFLAGVFQQSRWKARHLAVCREEPAGRLTRTHGRRTALLTGVRLGIHCCQACAGLTAAALAVGIMDVRVMVAMGIAITAERLAPPSMPVARATGFVGIALGMFLITRSVFSLG